jgi:hypothetical protein
MNGFAAATQLLSRAGLNGFFIEYVCLATSVVDAMLRIGLILRYQTENHTNEILDELLYQGEEDKTVPEREVYREALEHGIINEELFAQLNNLYSERNRVIHRYIISDITTGQVLDIGIRYEKVIPVISREISKLEAKQMELGVGMTVTGSEVTKSQLNQMSAKKHRDPNLIRKLGGQKPPLHTR